MSKFNTRPATVHQPLTSSLPYATQPVGSLTRPPTCGVEAAADSGRRPAASCSSSGRGRPTSVPQAPGCCLQHGSQPDTSCSCEPDGGNTEPDRWRQWHGVLAASRSAQVRRRRPQQGYALVAHVRVER